MTLQPAAKSLSSKDKRYVAILPSLNYISVFSRIRKRTCEVWLNQRWRKFMKESMWGGGTIWRVKAELEGARGCWI